MYLTTKEKFISYTIDPLHQLHDIDFKDVRTKQPYIVQELGNGYIQGTLWMEIGNEEQEIQISKHPLHTLQANLISTTQEGRGISV